MNTRDGIATANEEHWQRQAEKKCGFTVPWLDLDRDVVRRYAAGRLESVPAQLLLMHPASVLAEVEGKDVLCLACGGGQQSAVFGLLGARVTVVDLTEGQLDGDREAAAHYRYGVTAIHADMRDLSAVADRSFDLVYQAFSMAFAPDVRQVYSEVARVLRTGGMYKVDFTNPATEFVHENWDGVGYRITMPYTQKVRVTENGPIEFRHYLGDIFNGLIELGFCIRHVEEDPRHLCPDPQATPGSWPHSLMYLVGFSVVARKE